MYEVTFVGALGSEYVAACTVETSVEARSEEMRAAMPRPRALWLLDFIDESNQTQDYEKLLNR
jgi:hypothetical protein